ncbi:hypothetical protein TWF694_008221 [Orbilia ellipsospora]|uniref:Uncharacterized protein n=1 Tax=Orbilia ellipsospora TaxID=2528407 RepID=A0AAV9XFE9_9PEZI
MEVMFTDMRLQSGMDMDSDTDSDYDEPLSPGAPHFFTDNTSDPLDCSTCSSVQCCSEEDKSLHSDRHFRECQTIRRAVVALSQVEQRMLQEFLPGLGFHESHDNTLSGNIRKSLQGSLRIDEPYDSSTSNYHYDTQLSSPSTTSDADPMTLFEPRTTPTFEASISVGDPHIMRKYLGTRRALILDILEMDHRCALELALEQIMELRSVSQKQKPVDHFLLATLLRLGKDQECYDYISTFGRRADRGSKVMSPKAMSSPILKGVPHFDAVVEEGAGENIPSENEDDSAEETLKNASPTAKILTVPLLLLMISWKNDLKNLEGFKSIDEWLTGKLNLEIVQMIRAEIPDSTLIRGERPNLWESDNTELIRKVETQMTESFRILWWSKQEFWRNMVKAAVDGEIPLELNMETMASTWGWDLLTLYGRIYKDTKGAIEFIETSLADCDQEFGVTPRKKSLEENPGTKSDDKKRKRQSLEIIAE